MSSSYLMGASDADPEMGAFLQLRNSWGNQPMIWNALAKKYAREIGATGYSFDDWEKLIKWVYSPSGVLAAFELNVFAMADEGNYLEGDEDLLLYAESLRMFARFYSEPNIVCHLPSTADRIEELVREKKVRWLAWYGTSINANPWLITESEGNDGDEEDEEYEPEYRPYNMLTDLGKPLFDSRATVERMKMLPLDHPPASYSDVRQYRAAPSTPA